MNAEAARQQRLLASLAAPAALATPAGQDGQDGEDDRGFDPRGLAAYRAHAAALAERALAAAFPTVRQVLGEATFAAVARRLWLGAPPRRGDLAQWGGALPVLLALDPALADEPYLADLARVDLAVHRAESAADAMLDPAHLARLGQVDPARLRLRLAPGAWWLRSAHPVATIWAAHRSEAPDRFVAVRAARAAGQGEQAFVWRQGWRGQVVALSDADATFMASLARGATLAEALDATPELDVQSWLLQALRLQWLSDVEIV